MITESIIASAAAGAAEKVGTAVVAYATKQALEHVDDIACGCVEVVGDVACGGLELVGDVLDGVFSIFD